MSKPKHKGSLYVVVDKNYKPGKLFTNIEGVMMNDNGFTVPNGVLTKNNTLYVKVIDSVVPWSTISETNNTRYGKYDRAKETSKGGIMNRAFISNVKQKRLLREKQFIEKFHNTLQDMVSKYLTKINSVNNDPNIEVYWTNTLRTLYMNIIDAMVDYDQGKRTLTDVEKIINKDVYEFSVLPYISDSDMDKMTEGLEERALRLVAQRLINCNKPPVIVLGPSSNFPIEYIKDKKRTGPDIKEHNTDTNPHSNLVISDTFSHHSTRVKDTVEYSGTVNPEYVFNVSSCPELYKKALVDTYGISGVKEPVIIDSAKKFEEVFGDEPHIDQHTKQDSTYVPRNMLYTDALENLKRMMHNPNPINPHGISSLANTFPSMFSIMIKKPINMCVPITKEEYDKHVNIPACKYTITYSKEEYEFMKRYWNNLFHSAYEDASQKEGSHD